MTRLNRTLALLPVLVLLLSGCGVAVSPTSTPRAVHSTSSMRDTSRFRFTGLLNRDCAPA